MTIRGRILAGVAVIVVLPFVALGGLLGFAGIERLVPVTLPTPSGPMPVGRTILDWKDSTGVDSAAPVAGKKRELLVWIWYPAVSNAGKIDDYVPADLRVPPGAVRGNIMTFLTRPKVRDHTMRDAALSPATMRYPVLLMRGGASTGVLSYSSTAEDLASHGYVVVGFDAPYRSSLVVFPDGRTVRETRENNPELCGNAGAAQEEQCITRIVRAWTADLAFALDRLAQLDRADSASRFTGRLDLSRVGVFGHSLGGATAAEFCHEDSRCRAGVDVDGAPTGSVVQTGMAKPFLFVLADHAELNTPEGQAVNAKIASIYEHLPAGTRLRVRIRGAEHYLFSDDAAVLKSHSFRALLRVIGQLHIDGRRQLAVTDFVLRTFFDAYVKGSAPRPTILAAKYPELIATNGAGEPLRSSDSSRKH